MGNIPRVNIPQERGKKADIFFAHNGFFCEIRCIFKQSRAPFFPAGFFDPQRGSREARGGCFRSNS